MRNLMTKIGIGTAVAATAMMAAAPAQADRYRGYYGRDRGGDVATGAIVGGIVGLGLGAAIASSNRGPGWGGGYYGNGYYNNGYYPRGYYNQRFYAPPRRFYRQRCFTQMQFDPYWGRPVPVRICR